MRRVHRNDALAECQIEQDMHFAEMLGDVGRLHSRQVLKLIPIGNDMSASDLVRLKVTDQLDEAPDTKLGPCQADVTAG